MKSDGTSVPRLTDNPAIDSEPSWSLDGRKIDDEVDRIRTEREGWREELAKLQQRLEAKLELVARKQRLEDICQTIDVGFDDLSFEQKREILQGLGLRMRVKQDRSYECFAVLPTICETSPTLENCSREEVPVGLKRALWPLRQEEPLSVRIEGF